MRNTVEVAAVAVAAVVHQVVAVVLVAHQAVVAVVLAVRHQVV